MQYLMYRSALGTYVFFFLPKLLFTYTGLEMCHLQPGVQRVSQPPTPSGRPARAALPAAVPAGMPAPPRPLPCPSKETHLQVGAQRQPDLDVLHLLQSEVRYFVFPSFPGGSNMAEEFCKQKSLGEAERNHKVKWTRAPAHLSDCKQ